MVEVEMETTDVTAPPPGLNPAGPVEDESDDGSVRTTYTWIVPNYKKLLENQSKAPIKQISDSFNLADTEWRLTLFPRGNSQDKSRGEFISLFLDVADMSDPARRDALPPGWSRSTHFVLKAISHGGDKAPVEGYHMKATDHIFTTRDGSDWGFGQFMALSDILDPARGFLDNSGALHLSVELVVKDDPANPSYDSRARTGSVGLKNQGATCYMNSLLQTLFHINNFRKAVYQMPTSTEEDPEKSLPLALQQLFWKLQYGPTCVGTKALTRSFGWADADAFEQHDVQELNRILCDKLEQKMKGSAVERQLNWLFEGHVYNYIECLHVDFRSTRVESFMDLQLDVKGCADVYDSFDKYTERERLEGDNKYDAEGHGHQDATKGVLFQDLPPVLQLHLKRFEYDFMRDMVVKWNGQYKFYDTLDLDRDNGKYLGPKADRSRPNRYKLHSVLVHTGTGHGGHYYAFIRPDGKQWLKFDDEKVTREKTSRATVDQFGEEEGAGGDPLRTGMGGYTLRTAGRLSNAYMLVYVRESDWDEVMCPVAEEDLDEALRDRFRREAEDKERRRRDKAEQHLFATVRAFWDQDVGQRMSSGQIFDLCDADACHQVRVRREDPVSVVRDLLAKEVSESLGRPIPPERLRLWCATLRGNQTSRPERHIPEERLGMSVKDLLQDRDFLRSVQDVWRMYVELLPEPTPSAPLPLPPPGDAIVFVKEYDALAETVTYHRAVLCSIKTTTLHEVVSQVAAAWGAAADDYDAWEEVKSDPVLMTKIPTTSLSRTLKLLDLDSGDIIVMQKKKLPEGATPRFPSAEDFFRHVRGRKQVAFRPVTDPRAEGFTLDLQDTDSYEAVSEAVCHRLGLPGPLHVQLWQRGLGDKPAHLPVRYGDKKVLADLLTFVPFSAAPGAPTHALFYRPLERPLPEYERYREYEVWWWPGGGPGALSEYRGPFKVILPEDARASDLAETVRRELSPSDPHADPSTSELRVVALLKGRVHRHLAPDADVSRGGFYVSGGTSGISARSMFELRVEPVGEGDRPQGEGDRLVQCTHVSPNQGRAHSAPSFLMVVSPSDTWADVRARIHRKVDVPAGEDFSSWRLGVFYPSKNSFEAAADETQPLDPAFFAAREAHLSSEGHYQYQAALAVEHEDKVPLSQRRAHKQAAAGGLGLKIN